MGEITVSGLGKAYRQYPTQWSRLAEWLSFDKASKKHVEHWVLRDVNFRVGAGEAVGIVGNNGAGKSTLLKLITGTLKPTTGEITSNGRISALLELGMGFHPDFTGRQNAIMGGQLLGLSVEEIAELIPEIEAFAEIGEYIDQPIRTYSSGMQIRLAFSVATALRPDILIVDEALSVGDSYFQHKSFERIREFQRKGTTLLIVSHDRYAIQTICDKAILLEHGQVRMQGSPVDILDYYNALMAERETQTVIQEQLPDGRMATTSGTGEARCEKVRLLNAAGEPVEAVNVGDPVTLEVHVRIHAPLPRLVLGFMIKDRFGQAIYGINTHRTNDPIMDPQPGELIVYRFQFPARIGKGSYSVALSLSQEDSHVARNYEWRDNALLFHVYNHGREDFVGYSWLDARNEIIRDAVDGAPPTPSQ
ncbi:MAG: ABC transporter ATP-binding protein [Pseudoxanthomonas sp.]